MVREKHFRVKKIKNRKGMEGQNKPSISLTREQCD